MQRATAFALSLVALLVVTAGAARAQAGDPPWWRGDADSGYEINLYFYWSATCPYCADAKVFLERAARDRPWLRLVSRELGRSERHVAEFEAMAARVGRTPEAVPAFFVCGYGIIGYDDEQGVGAALMEVAEACRAELQATGEFELPAPRPPPLVLRLPWLGEMDAGALSLPALTMVLGGLDAFNPCAFFVLLFLLSLMIHARSRLRMAVIGGVFVAVSGVMYFAFMAAWLNLFLLLEGFAQVTVVAGLIAVAFAALNIKDYFLFRQGPSLAIPEGAKPGLFGRMRALLSAGNTAALLVGTIGLAVAANFYELLCTSGFPLVYTRILTLNELSPAGHYLYLALYNVVYVVPLMLIVAVFTATMGARRLSETQGRALKLLSGLMMLGLGLVLLIAPELLDNILTAALLLAGALLLTAVTVLVSRHLQRA